MDNISFTPFEVIGMAAFPGTILAPLEQTAQLQGIDTQHMTQRVQQDRQYFIASIAVTLLSGAANYMFGNSYSSSLAMGTLALGSGFKLYNTVKVTVEPVLNSLVGVAVHNFAQGFEGPQEHA
jgi:hypothetical protein